MPPKQHQIKFIKFLQKHSEKWHTFASDKLTTEIACSLHNLGIASVNRFNQIRLRSNIKAEQFLVNQ